MLISEGNDGNDIEKYILNSINKNYIELVGSKFKLDLKTGSEKILNKIKYIIETNKVLILKDLDIIYKSLYGLFSQNFTYMCEKKFVKIYPNLFSEVDKDFRIIIIVSSEQIKNGKITPPLLNRFEKHIP